ncbi:LysR family transcriptional regulator [Actinomadura opuntiae]|uniref:LysR family transcriptional regulator n=1 Tax=Actinomadura sp. OS1-43 TaxID=604315 RepID=UPI00255B16CB|nr:LysR family transcriptional regulator [Actinomadura sp. OS1-43]MDL4817180.1 LysR family transcriptional regulator [Actinomadura sp. OS1-43]
MELREVEAFLVVADELNFGRAADRLRCSAGRVSQLIRSLESKVGGALFERSSRRVRLTPLGERFRAGTSDAYGQLLETMKETQLAARSIGERLRLGYASTIGGELPIRLAEIFEARHPDCTVVLNVVRTDPETPLEENDMVLCWSPAGDGRDLRRPGLTVGPVLRCVPRALLVPAGHPLTRESAVRLDDLLGYEMLRLPGTVPAHLRDLWTPRFTRSGQPLKHTANDMAALLGRPHPYPEDILTLVARGHGLHCTVATYLERFPFPGLALVTIEDLAPAAAVLVWRTPTENSTIRAFANTAAFDAGDRRWSKGAPAGTGRNGGHAASPPPRRNQRSERATAHCRVRPAGDAR